MKTGFLFCLISVLGLCCSCSTISTVKLDSSTGKTNYPPIPEEQVIVLFKAKPARKVEEIAVVSYQTGIIKAENWYKNIRTEAAKNGAHVVFNIKVSSKLEHTCRTTCNSNGSCFTTCSDIPVFAISGTLGRFK